MAEVILLRNERAREDWRRVNSHIHKEEQQLKELQLDYNEKVAVVEALKLELRQLHGEMHACQQTEVKLMQSTYSQIKQLQGLQAKWQALQVDRSMLLQQLAAEQDGLKQDQAKIQEAKVMFEQELHEQQAYVQQLQALVDA